MRYEVAITLEGKITDIITVDGVYQVIVSKGVYFLKSKRGQPIFTSPIERTVYIREV